MRYAAICLMAVMIGAAAGPAAEPAKSIPAANNLLGLDLLAKLPPSPHNLFFSPYSIESAMAMAQAGAAGDTAKQMADVLHLSPDTAKMTAEFAALRKALGAAAGPDAPFQLMVSNSLWVQKGIAIQQGYLDLVNTRFAAEVTEVEFNAPAQTANIINAAIAKQTNNAIRDLLTPHMLDPNARLLLTDAIYFKSPWETQFDPEASQPGKFHMAGGVTRDVFMMHEQAELPYVQNDDYTAAELPYASGRLAMLILLPRKPDGLPDLEKSLTADSLDKCIDSLRPRQVALALPKFKLTMQTDLGQALSDLGMTDAFSKKADFSPMSTDKNLCIGKVLHQAVIEIDEHGTQAAAATAVEMRPTAILGGEPVALILDHPFFFVIRHRTTGVILFMGRLADVPVMKMR